MVTNVKQVLAKENNCDTIQWRYVNLPESTPKDA
uniref:Uncharacterized protein n=1 Tax=Onchocerca volvulus TaxID=6282 RepID=A0A8R1Y2H8_ONCVO